MTDPTRKSEPVNQKKEIFTDALSANVPPVKTNSYAVSREIALRKEVSKKFMGNMISYFLARVAVRLIDLFVNVVFGMSPDIPFSQIILSILGFYIYRKVLQATQKRL